MIYLRNKRIIAFFLAVFLFLVFLGTGSLDKIFVKIFYRFFPERHERNIAEENAILYQKIRDLKQELSQKEVLPEAIRANIILGGGYIFSDSIILDKGIEDGVEKGDFVVYELTIAVAKIEEVFNGFSKAVPFSRFSREVALRSGPGKNILFKGEGMGGREISALLPRGSGLNAGDAAYLAENPKFLVGLVYLAEKKESRDFEKISILLPFSLGSISEIGIFKNYVKE